MSNFQFQIKKIFRFFLEPALHLVAVGIIITAFFPMAKWYFDAKPLWGVDFYYTVALVNLIKSNLTLPPVSWNYAWFAGWPNFSSFPMLHYFLIVPFTYFLDLLLAVKLWTNLSMGLYVLGIYACSYVLSRNRGLAVILAIASVYSVGVYGALMWGGSLPNFATQAFFPWTLFFIILYLKSGKTSWLLSGACSAGLSILGHPQIAISYVFPSSAILFCFSFGQLKTFERVKKFILFLIIATVIGLPVIYSSTGALKYFVITDATDVATSTARVDSSLDQDIRAFHLAQPKRIYTDTNKTLFYFLGLAGGLYLLSLLLRHRRDDLLASIPYIVLTLFYIIYIHLFAYGVSIFHGGWYRLFWSVPVWIGLLISVWWGTGESTLKDRLGRISFTVSPLLTILALAIGVYLLQINSSRLKEEIVLRSNPSSAFPDVLNLRSDKAGSERLKKEMIPAWLNGQNTDYRLYDGDQTVNIWWNSLYNMPLARGYFDPPKAPALGYRFWIDAALSVDNATQTDQLAGAFHLPPEIAFNNTLFLVDWYAIKFFEGGREGPTTFAPFPKKLTGENMLAHEEVLDFNKEKYNSGNQTLRYYEIKDEFVTPILMPSNVPALGIFASDEGYETIVRSLADANLGSRQVIPIKLGQDLGKLNPRELSTFDALLLYNYKYENKSQAFGSLNEYVTHGGKLFVDTGVETPESNAKNLPEFFPISSTNRDSLGREWDLVGGDSSLNQDINFTNFDPPLFDNAGWKFSYPPVDSDVRKTAQVVLTNHAHPIVVTQTIGNGEVIWSGLNLPYHVIRFHNKEEIRYFSRILKSLLPVNTADANSLIPKTKFISAQKRSIVVPANFRGVLFKEQNYPGWHADIRYGNNSKALEIWTAGPAYPGFMYISLPKEALNSESVVTFSYRGSPVAWFFSILSFIAIVYIVEGVVFRGIIIGRGTKWIFRSIKIRMQHWWVKDDS